MGLKIVMTWCMITCLVVFGSLYSVAQTDVQSTPGVENQTESSQPENQTDQPSAFIPEMQFVFSPVVEGVEVNHDFILQNKGTAVLNIENVKTG